LPKHWHPKHRNTEAPSSTAASCEPLLPSGLQTVSPIQNSKFIIQN
jgi:hypothetical protein